MRRVFIILIVFICCSCIKVGSNTSSTSSSSNVVFYTRGATDRISNLLDEDSFSMLPSLFVSSAEYFPNENGQFVQQDQTRQEIFDSVTELVELLNDNDNVYWFLFGHGLPGLFTAKDYESPRYPNKKEVSVTYEELFSHFQDQLTKNKKGINRLHIIILSCHSGSLINTIKQDKYKNGDQNHVRLYKELVVFTTVTEAQEAYTMSGFPLLLNAATYMKVASQNTGASLSELMSKTSERLKGKRNYPLNFPNVMVSNPEACASVISYSTPVSRNPPTHSKQTIYTQRQQQCTLPNGVQPIVLSSRSNPSWKDLWQLSKWLLKTQFKNSVAVNQDPQLYTDSDATANSSIFN